MVYLTQLLCPQRHCLMAAAWEEHRSCASEAEHQLRELFAEAVKSGRLNPYCGLCRSETLHCESQRTSWSTLAEAEPQLRKQEREHLLVAAAAASHTG